MVRVKIVVRVRWFRVRLDVLCGRGAMSWGQISCIQPDGAVRARVVPHSMHNNASRPVICFFSAAARGGGQQASPMLRACYL